MTLHAFEPFETPPRGTTASDFEREIERELERLDATLAGIDAGAGPVGDGVRLFLSRQGKRLRPRAVLLAAAVGEGIGPAARRLALASELVHGATLLHDDVIDRAAKRRGAATVGAALGSSIAILSGDWLLMKGMERVRRAGVAGTLGSLIDVVTEMISAESAQLASRDRAAAERAAYLRIARQKTAGLFEWSLVAGGRAGGLDDPELEALGRAGLHLGVGFQIADDLADLVGDPEGAEEALFADLRQGLRTYPLILALERQPGLCALVDEASAAPDVAGGRARAACRRVVAATRELGVVADTRRAVGRRRERALEALSELPASAATSALSRLFERALPALSGGPSGGAAG